MEKDSFSIYSSEEEFETISTKKNLEYLPVVYLSCPTKIKDRDKYLNFLKLNKVLNELFLSNSKDYTMYFNLNLPDYEKKEAMILAISLDQMNIEKAEKECKWIINIILQEIYKELKTQKTYINFNRKNIPKSIKDYLKKFKQKKEQHSFDLHVGLYEIVNLNNENCYKKNYTWKLSKNIKLIGDNNFINDELRLTYCN